MDGRASTAAKSASVASRRPPCSILVRAIEQDVLPTCQRYGMGVIPYSPLAGGWLSGRYRTDADVQGPNSSARRRRASYVPASVGVNGSELYGPLPLTLAFEVNSPPPEQLVSLGP